MQGDTHRGKVMEVETEKRQRIGYVALVVRDYDQAIEYYTNALGFEVVEDTALGGDKRWVLLAPPGSVERPRPIAPRHRPEAAARDSGPIRAAPA